MRRYKIVACILLILSVFGFVLAAPVAVQEVREACTDVVDGGDKVIIGLGKREEDASESSPSSSQLQGSTSIPSGTRPNPSPSPVGAQARPKKVKPKNVFKYIFGLMGRPKFWRG